MLSEQRDCEPQPRQETEAGRGAYTAVTCDLPRQIVHHDARDAFTTGHGRGNG
jgi:hypothetical protein